MDSIIIALLGILVGWLTFPMVLFLRARRADGWDKSNMTNIYRVIAHIGTHPGDFLLMRYPDGSNPFWYLGEDEISDVVETRPKQ